MFGHLVNYSCYSFQESTMLIHPFVKRAKDLKIEALALTDKDNMYGAIEFKKACQKYNIKPIYGLEASVAIDEETYPLVLLAKDEQGYFSLVKISSDIQLSSNKSISLDSLKKYKEHLFFLCLGEEGILERLILKDLENEAVKYIKLFKNIFDNHFYIGIQNHGIALQQNVNQQLMALAKALRVKVVCTNQNSYLLPSEALALDYLKASKEQVILSFNHEPKTNQKYLKTEAEMRKIFKEDIINETIKLIEQCNSDIPLHTLHLPKYPINGDVDSSVYLRELCKVGLRKRFHQRPVPIDYIKRLNYEMDVISSMNYSDYFLIVWDYVRYAKSKGILVGPGRGSAAGSLVSYVLGITNADPIAYDLIFERFLNPERISMPDIDIDFQDDRRDEIVNYLIEKYGHKHVAQIVTFNTYGPKVAIKDLGKVAAIPLGKLETLSKLIPTNYKFRKSAKEVYQTSAQFQNLVNRDSAIEKFIPSVFVIESLPKNISTHAAGVVLCGEEIDQIVPLVVGPTKTLMTQYSKDYIEEAGLLKMDILGLRNLTIISSILQQIKHSKEIVIDLNTLAFDDKKTYQMIASGDTFGVFQLESEGMRSLLKKMKVSEFEDIIAAVALYRPGPMENIPSYLNRKLNKEKIDYIHEDLEEILRPTYGIIIYQEQILQIATKMAGFSLGKADILRKAITKKERDLMESMQDEFVDGALNNGYTMEKANEVFQLIVKFANYGFNRSHSVAYAMVAYQLAYLKVNYPLEFFAALLSNDYNSDSHKLACMQEAKKYNVSILPPSINYSHKAFLVENGGIRYSLLSIKNVGIAAFQDIIQERETNGLFCDIYDFFARMYRYKISSKALESLIDAGAFDDFDINRKTIKENSSVLENYAKLHGTIGFDELPILVNIKESKNEILQKEKEVLGIYLSAHPVSLYKQQLNKEVVSVHQLNKYIENRVTLVLYLQRVRIIKDKLGNYMCFISAFDETGEIEGVVFSNVFEQYQNNLNRGNIVIVNAKVTYKDTISIVVNSVENIK